MKLMVCSVSSFWQLERSEEDSFHVIQLLDHHSHHSGMQHPVPQSGSLAQQISMDWCSCLSCSSSMSSLESLDDTSRPFPEFIVQTNQVLGNKQHFIDEVVCNIWSILPYLHGCSKLKPGQDPEFGYPSRLTVPLLQQSQKACTLGNQSLQSSYSHSHVRPFYPI